MAYQVKLKDVEKLMLRGIQLGLSVELACKYAGIAVPTYYKWMSIGRRHIENSEKSEYSEFYENVERTKGKCAARYLESLEKVAIKQKKPDWRAAAWLLERRFKDYMPRQAIDITGLSFEDALALLPEEYADKLRQAIKARIVADKKDRT